MVLAFLSDNRFDEEHRSAENTQLEAKSAPAQAQSAQQEAQLTTTPTTAPFSNRV